MTASSDILTAKNEALPAIQVPQTMGAEGTCEEGNPLELFDTFWEIQTMYVSMEMSQHAGHHVLPLKGLAGKSNEQHPTAMSLGGGRATSETSKQKLLSVSTDN